MTDEESYTHFINNQRMANHELVVFGIRELNSTEMDAFCSNYQIDEAPPIFDKRATFSSNYRLRIYTSGCYYLDKNNNWQSDGVLVSSHDFFRRIR